MRAHTHKHTQMLTHLPTYRRQDEKNSKKKRINIVNKHISIWKKYKHSHSMNNRRTNKRRRHQRTHLLLKHTAKFELASLYISMLLYICVRACARRTGICVNMSERWCVFFFLGLFCSLYQFLIAVRHISTLSFVSSSITLFASFRFVSFQHFETVVYNSHRCCYILRLVLESPLPQKE